MEIFQNGFNLVHIYFRIFNNMRSDHKQPSTILDLKEPSEITLFSSIHFRDEENDPDMPSVIV